uniref:GRIP domain-containing protein n=1 Tax=Globisporangium ultimum (strain ATCC 200006 / CBS 805.95 / DAOM BR144) TaxID=431595 RepID=K3X6M5_GLOUD
MMKKEKLEQMRELGRGGLSKGLTMLRNAAEKAAAAAEAANSASAQNAATNYVAIGPSTSAADDASDASSSASGGSSAGSANGNAGSNKLTYDELVTLSMKLTRQNKMMKAQFQKMQARITQLNVKEADAQVLTDFVANVVGVDLDACQVSESKSDADSAEKADEEAMATIDAKELKERYAILQELNEREHKRIEERLRAELSTLRSDQQTTQRTSSDGGETASLLSFSPVAAAPTPANYDEIDLLGGPTPPRSVSGSAADFADFGASGSSATSREAVAKLEKQLEDAMTQLEKMQEQLQVGAAENEELQKKLNDAAQRTEQVDELTIKNETLEQSVAELKRTVSTFEVAELEWQKRWSEQSDSIAKIQQELQDKMDAEAHLAAENAAIKSKLDEVSSLLAKSKQESFEDGPDVADLQSQLLRLNEELASMQQSLSSAEASISLTEDEKQALSRQIDELNSVLVSKDDELKKVQAELTSLQEDKATLSARKESDSEKDDADDTEILSLKEQITSMASEISAKEEKLVELEKSLALAQSRNENSDTNGEKCSNDDRQEAQSQDDMDQQIANLNQEVESLKQENEILHAKLKQIGESKPAQGSAEEITALLGELEKVKMERAEIDHSVRTLKDKLRVAETEQKTANAEVERCNSLVDALKENTSRLADELESLRREKDEAASKLASLQAELDAAIASKESLEEELGVLRQDTHANLENTLAEVEETKRKVEAVELEKAQMEGRMAEEREYLTSKIEMLVKEFDTVNKKNDELHLSIVEKEKQVQKMAASQSSMTAEMMELQTQLSSMRQDLHMAAEGLEAHATRAEQSDLKRQEIEGKMANMKLQMDSLRDEHRNDFEMLRQEKEAELERVKQDRSVIARKLSELESVRNDMSAKYASLEVEYHEEQQRAAELEAKISQQTTEIGNLSVDLAETKKALSDRMGLATRLQTENMGIAAKQAEQAALIENALREAALHKEKTHEMETKMLEAKNEMERVKRIKEDTVAEMKKVKQEVDQQKQELQAEKEQSAIEFQAAVNAEKEAFKREIERIEAESKVKSKRALQVVLEKEGEIERLTKRLTELEEDVRSGDADNRKIFEFAQLQAKREAESRAQAMQLQDMTDQLQEAYRQIQRLQEEKQNHDQELTALMQTQRREGVNMEYLKNVVVQYMSFRPGSSQQERLVPVLSTLLQFSAGDMKEIKNASSARRSSWTSWATETKDYKPILGDGKGQRHSMIPPSPAGSSTMGSLDSTSRASSFTLPSSDPSAFESHSASERADF